MNILENPILGHSGDLGLTVAWKYQTFPASFDISMRPSTQINIFDMEYNGWHNLIISSSQIITLYLIIYFSLTASRLFLSNYFLINTPSYLKILLSPKLQEKSCEHIR